MTMNLCEGVFAVACDEDLVVLDIRADHYSCLPEVTEVMTVEGGRIFAPAEVLEQLAAAGLATTEPVRPRRDPPAKPVRKLPLVSPPSLGDRLAMAFAVLAAWTSGPGRRPLADLLADQARRPLVPARKPDLEKIGRLTAAFVEGLPWDPLQGVCLYRAWLLRRLLHAQGETADWVFGVRTFPFGAHCWLQIDDLVLDDDPDRVALYTPIMVV